MQPACGLPELYIDERALYYNTAVFIIHQPPFEIWQDSPITVLFYYSIKMICLFGFEAERK